MIYSINWLIQSKEFLIYYNFYWRSSGPFHISRPPKAQITQAFVRFRRHFHEFGTNSKKSIGLPLTDHCRNASGFCWRRGESQRGDIVCDLLQNIASEHKSDKFLSNARNKLIPKIFKPRETGFLQFQAWFN